MNDDVLFCYACGKKLNVLLEFINRYSTKTGLPLYRKRYICPTIKPGILNNIFTGHANFIEIGRYGDVGCYDSLGNFLESE